MWSSRLPFLLCPSGSTISSFSLGNGSSSSSVIDNTNNINNTADRTTRAMTAITRRTSATLTLRFQPSTSSSSSSSLRRCFHSKADYQQWRKDVQDSALKPSNNQTTTMRMEPLDLPTFAPFLHSVSPMADQLFLAGVQDATPSSPRDSLLECTYPLASNEILRYSVTDFSHWSAFRLGKFYELVDALTADVAYRHAAANDGTNGSTDDNNNNNNNNEEVTLVTAGHYHSRKYGKTDLHKDVVLRSYVTQVGRSSLEVRTDAWQDEDKLVNVCHTIMVALDPKTMKPLSKVGKALPPLISEDDGDEDRIRLADQHQQIRLDRSQKAMQLRNKVSAPPTIDEMGELHRLHRRRALQREGQFVSGGGDGGGITGSNDNSNTLACSPTVQDYTFRSSRVIFPEQRNVHGKLFGGFVMAEGQSLAQFAATFFAMGNPIVPMGIDEAIFLQPVALGDMVTFTARLVHATATTCRVNVTVEVRDPSAPSRVPVRSNRLVFVFCGDFSNNNRGNAEIIPETYQEILMHVDAQRRHAVEGPWEDEVKGILEEMQKGNDSSST
ncbi:unnamed protein product [Cylindrotheca closterium]|uniref:HotDog ACOT-type domain-containing protein n=1 Tax=Cylindrotheca closterium TaxID=2856 RepID=A0AAD2GBS9_9STRA|nr:unnamed protein product [Cylindrotheca closterium]